MRISTMVGDRVAVFGASIEHEPTREYVQSHGHRGPNGWRILSLEAWRARPLNIGPGKCACGNKRTPHTAYCSACWRKIRGKGGPNGDA